MQVLLFLHSARRLMLIDICMKFHEDSLRGSQVTERTRFMTDRQTDGQTDRQTDARGKTICLPTLKGGDITLCDAWKTAVPAALIYMSGVVRKPAFCIWENKGADQLRGNREADQRLCFRYMDSTIPLLPTSKISHL